MVWVALKRIWINSIGNAIGLLFSIVLIFIEPSVLLAIVVSPALLFFVSFYFMNKEIYVFQLAVPLLISRL
jgi:PST family polysaccharide transporter